ncbi:MAG: DUF2066 domain-containing protein [Alphaproteobacteria bacterium]
MQHFVPGRTLWIALAATLLLALPARAEQADVFVVTGVKVEAKGARPDLARAKAVADGEQAALARLLRKLTLAEDHARLPKPDAEAVRNAVRNFSVEIENQQGDRYTASVAYRFDRDSVRAMLEGAGVPFLEAPSPPLVVLPAWREDGKLTLWDDPNPWREAWLRHEPGDTLADFARLRGDLADLKAISGEEAASGNRAALGRIGDNYKAGLVAVAVATVEKGQRRIAVQLYDLANGRTSAVGVFPAGTDEAGLDKAAAAIARAIDAAWKKSAVLIEQNAAVVRIRAPLQGLEHWIKIRQSLSSMPQLRGLTTLSMSPGEALIELRFAGTIAELRRQLDQRGMAVTVEPAKDGAPETWLLKPPSTAVKETDLAPAPGTPPAKAEERPKDGAAPDKKTEPPKKP